MLDVDDHCVRVTHAIMPAILLCTSKDMNGRIVQEGWGDLTAVDFRGDAELLHHWPPPNFDVKVCASVEPHIQRHSLHHRPDLMWRFLVHRAKE